MRRFLLSVVVGFSLATTSYGFNSVGTLARAEEAHQRPRIERTTMGRPLLRVVARERAGTQPKSVNVSPDGSLVVVCNFGRRDHESVTFHDPETLARIGMVEFEGNAVESAFSPDGRTLYVSNFRRDRVEVIDVQRRVVTSEIEVGQHPKTIVVSADGNTIYVANWGSRAVSVVDVRRGVEVRRLRTGDHPRGMHVLENGHLMVASFEDHYIQEYDPETGSQIRRIRACRYPRDIVMGPDPSRFFVTCTLGSVGYFDMASGERVGLGSVGSNPRSLGISDDGRWLVTANFGLGGRRRGSVTVVDTRAQTSHTTLVPRVNRFVGLAVSPGANLRVYATSWDTSEVIALAP